jgi:hypothetical protein
MRWVSQEFNPSYALADQQLRLASAMTATVDRRCVCKFHVRHLETYGSFEERARLCRFVTHSGNERSFPLCSQETIIMAAVEAYAGFRVGAI